MTELTITPKVSDKTARFNGTVAAGEHVAVTIKGGAEWLGEDDGANLTLRVLDLVTGRTLAVFPRPSETVSEPSASADAEPDSWTTAGDDNADLYCELNLNTTRMVAAARHMLRVPVLFVLGDTDDPRTLYFRDRYEIEYWPERIGDTVPYDLDKWPKQIDEWTELVAGFSETLDGHVGDNVRHITASERATWNSKYAKPVGGIPVNDLAGGVKSALAAIPGKADKSATYTKTEVDSLVSGMASGVFVVADSLPATGEANKIYLVPNGSGAAGNVRDEYMWVNGAWELIGSTQVDLSDYYDKTVADGRFVQKEAGKGLFSGSYNDLTDKPTIPAPVDIIGKLDGAAAYPEWVQDDYEPPDIVSHKGRLWRCQNYTISEPGEEPLSDWLEVSIEVLKQDALSDAQMNAVNSGATAEKVAVWDGYAAQIAQKASMSDLPYALVTPGEWEFSGVPEGVADVVLSWSGTAWDYTYMIGTTAHGGRIIRPITEPPFDGNELSLTFSIESSTVTATRASLPGHLVDRAGNRVVVSGDTTLTLPALEYAGRLRDFLVRLEISGSTVPTITFAAPTGETITYETDGDEFPAPDAEGTWLYSFTETAAHTFAVALKSVSVVTQGGV